MPMIYLTDCPCLVEEEQQWPLEKALEASGWGRLQAGVWVRASALAQARTHPYVYMREHMRESGRVHVPGCERARRRAAG